MRRPGATTTATTSLDGSQEDWGAHFAKRKDEAEAAAKRADEDKMAGFYVDLNRDSATVHPYRHRGAVTIAEDLQTAAQVVEMLLIKDLSRMKFNATIPYDSTHEQQHSLLPMSHPEDWSAASEEFKRGDYLQDPLT